MKKIYRITPTGTIEGLYSDMLSEAGEASIVRASEVEYDNDAQGWTVKILLKPFENYVLPEVFPRRGDALKAEVEFLNAKLLEGVV